MAFDIFGNTLKPGYCEVHPSMNEEYPCSLCVSESFISNQQQGVTDEVRELKFNMGQQDEQIKLLTGQNIRLKEQLTQAQEHILTAKTAIKKCFPNPSVCFDSILLVKIDDYNNLVDTLNKCDVNDTGVAGMTEDKGE